MSDKSDKKENLEPKDALIPSFLVNKLTASSRNSKSSGKQLGADICTFAPGEKISREQRMEEEVQRKLLYCSASASRIKESSKKSKDA